MQKYLVQVDLSGNELQEMNQAAEREVRDMAREIVESVGGSILSVYYSLGEPDIVVIVEMPDAEAVAQAAFAYNQKVEGELDVSPAFTAEEFDEIVEHLDQTPE
jgi:uncharacterized protein with GYD domain